MGLSSLQQLSCSPFTELMIDRSFVDGAAQSPRKLAILEWIAGLARALKLRVVAEAFPCWLRGFEGFAGGDAQRCVA